VYQSLLDVEHGLLIGLFSGADNTDEDYQRYVDSLIDADRRKPRATGAIAVLVVERGNPIPSAAWRKRIADATGALGNKDVLFILCSADPLMGGVVTAINWLRPPKYEVKVTSTLPAALAVIATRRPGAVQRADEMVRALQSSAG
jgi:hypothetical protein